MSTRQAILWIVRCVTVSLGFLAVWWGIETIPIFWTESPIAHIAARVAVGDTFPNQVLIQALAAAERIDQSKDCVFSAPRSAAIIELRLREVARDIRPGDASSESLTKAVHTSLSCTPADSLLWLVLYWTDSTKGESRPLDDLKYLRMSYEVGPQEGWISLMRNRLAFDNFHQLSPYLAAKVIGEFVGLVKSGFYEQAADILSKSAWQERERILPPLEALPIQSREAFAAAVYKHDLDVTIPGVRKPER